MKTSMEFDEELWKAVRRIALEEDTTARALVEEALKEIIEKYRKVLVRAGRS